MRPLFLAAALASLAGCGPSTLSDSQHAQSTSRQLEAVVSAHTASTAATTPARCPGELASYQASATRLIDELGHLCPGLDRCMAGMGHGGDADMMTQVNDLRAELALHVTQGCSAPDVSAELSRHQAAMLHCTGVLETRTGSMGGMLGGGMMSGPGCN